MAFTCCIVQRAIENSLETEVFVENGWETGGCTKPIREQFYSGIIVWEHVQLTWNPLWTAENVIK